MSNDVYVVQERLSDKANNYVRQFDKIKVFGSTNDAQDYIDKKCPRDISFHVYRLSRHKVQ